MKITSIHLRLMLLLLPCFLLSFGLLSGVSYYLSSQALSQSLDETAQAVETDYTRRIESYIHEAIVQQQAFAMLPGLRNPSDRLQLTATLTDCKNNSQYLESSVFIAQDGNAVRSDGSSVYLGDRDYFRKVIATQKPVVSELLLSKTTGKLAFNVAVPVVNNGNIAGVLTGSFAIDKLNVLIKDLKWLKSGYGLIASANGLVLAHARQPDLVGKLNLTEKISGSDVNLQQTMQDDRMLHMFKTSAETGQMVMGVYDFNGIPRIAQMSAVDLPGGQRWILVLTAPESEARQPLVVLTRGMIGVMLFCLLLTVGAIIFISRHIAAPIRRLRDETLELTNGDLRERPLTIATQDEIGQLAAGVVHLRGNWRDVIGRVLSDAGHVAAASEELTAGAQQSANAANQVAGSITTIAQGAASQAEASSRIAAVTQDLAAKTRELAMTADTIAGLAHSASQAAGQGQQAISQAIGQMRTIGDNSAVISAAMDELNTGSREINEIVTLIASIASQTNLLALNAAIEAARAGENGRGFAVVAEEVRKLAEQSSEAADKINQLIGQNQVNMDRATTATQTGVGSIRSGVELVGSAGDTFSAIAADVLNLSAQIDTISASIQQTVTATQSLAVATGEIDASAKTATAEAETVSAATEEQSASMEEIAASSQNLATLAASLQSSVARFQM
ncbi:methyl-accepting chemotaxis protein [Acetonema longum]|uniref:Methyl-accepting chemotaxis sensory transducer n=1 Tax=Acetonema longum DSM 6540 TaxID=1009370 RepID=F7NI10_9FIRM|nr:methyl-accepting chemotaxis protein [Acetonema longum]EGO64317.1 methyl-accepting chemotaxis sensory transducer [Acetonema longum DSM 6540]